MLTRMNIVEQGPRFFLGEVEQKNWTQILQLWNSSTHKSLLGTHKSLLGHTLQLTFFCVGAVAVKGWTECGQGTS